MRRFELHPNFRGADEIKDLLISTDFGNTIAELLLFVNDIFLFSETFGASEMTSTLKKDLKKLR